MIKSILFYTFNKEELNSFKVCKLLEVNKYNIFYLGNLKKLHSIIKNTKPKFIVGLGDKKAINNLMIETIYTNRYGNKEIVKGGKFQYKIELPRLDKVNIGYKKFGGFCNRASYSVTSFIDTSRIDTKNIFIHIPKSYNVIDIYDRLFKLLNLF